MSGQSVSDRLNAAKHSLAGSGLAKGVCKATTEEVTGPKRKHLDYLLQCTHEANVSVPQLADLLIQRTQGTNWVVVFKSLVTVHNVMNYGNERYQQYMASNTVCSNLDSFMDKSTPQGYDMSTYIRKYAKYINEKAVAYRTMAFDFCKVKRGKEDGLLRTMVPEKLLKALPVLQTQIDSLLEFDPSLNELNNGVINAAFLLLFKDLIRLFACYNDGIINLLEKFFDMNRKQCKEALDIYKKFLVRMDQTAEFLKVAENVGIDKGDIPDLTKAPASLLEALEAHLASLEGKKASKLQTKAPKTGAATLTEEEKKRILVDEEKELQRMKDRKEKAQREAQAAAASMESASHIPTQQTTEVIPPQAAVGAAPSASQDLLALDVNPFQAKADNVMSIAAGVPSSNQMWLNQNPLDPMSLSPAPANQPPPGAFTSETGFASAFGTTQPSAMSADLLDLTLGMTGSETAATNGSAVTEVATLDESNDSAEKTTSSAQEMLSQDNENLASCVENGVNEGSEATVDLLAAENSVMHVTIGGQSISIKTTPRAADSADSAEEDSVEDSPTTPQRSPRPKEEVSIETEASVKREMVEDESAVDLLADFAAIPTPATMTSVPAVANSDILDLLGGLDVDMSSTSAQPTVDLTADLAADLDLSAGLSGEISAGIDVVSLERASPQPGIMLLPTTERSITPSPSIVNPNHSAESQMDSLLPIDCQGNQLDLNSSLDSRDIKLSPRFHAKQSEEIPATPPPSPKPTSKVSKPISVPNNPLEAAMFKQLFPEKPKVVVKKSLAEMQAEGGNKAGATIESGVSPIMTRRDSRAELESGDSHGQLLQPQNKSAQAAAANAKLLNQDLDTSLASLAGNLAVNTGGLNRGNLQWTAPTEKKLTGGNNYSGIRPANSTWTQPQQMAPMTQPTQYMAQPTYGYNVSQPAAPFVYQQPQQPQQQVPYNMYNNNPAMMGMAPPTYQPMGMQQPMMQPMNVQQQTTNTNQQQDPFGNL